MGHIIKTDEDYNYLCTLVKEIKRYVLEKNEFYWDFNQNAYDLLFHCESLFSSRSVI